MKNTIVILLIILSFGCFSQSYPFKIKGQIKSKKGKSNIESATIHIEKVKDSSVISYTISNDKGEFSLKGKTFSKNINLVVSFIGMESYKKVLTYNDFKNYNAGTILLNEENLLDEVVIKSKAPIAIKKDTLEFNVKSFKTKKNATVEDLLKKLPGVEVDDQGKITINGKPVNKILVNGKSFFGNDLSIATKNLSKDIIEKVQVTNTKSKSDSFVGEKGDGDNKTINLTIKKENNKGWFGRVTAGGGTNKRYEFATMVNRFNDKQRFSVIASANNINSPGFSFGEIQKMFGGGTVWFTKDGSFKIGNRTFGGGKGIVKSKIGGFTYADEYGKKFDVNTNYFYSGSIGDNRLKRNREYTIPDRNYFTKSVSNSRNDNDNHNVDLEFDIKVTPSFLINIKPQFTYNKRNGFFDRTEKTLNSDNKLTNSFKSVSTSESVAKLFQNDINITKKLDTLGSYIKLNLKNKIDQTELDNYNNNEINTFSDNNTETRKQYVDGVNKTNNLDGKLVYRYPIIFKKLFLLASYNYQLKNQMKSNYSYNFDESKQDYSDFISNLSSDFNYKEVSSAPNLTVDFKSKKFSLMFGSTYMDKKLIGEDKLYQDSNLSRKFNAILFQFRSNYRFNNKASLYVSYRTNFNAPTVSQIQPFVNVSNPSNIIKGNENLKPEKKHSFYAGYYKYNWQKGTGISFNLGGTYNIDQVVNNSVIDSDFIRTTSYTNLDGAYSLWGGGRYNFKVKFNSVSNLKIIFNTWLNANKNVFVLNNQINKTNNMSITPVLGFSYDYKKIISIQPKYSVRFSKTMYNISKNQNQNFSRHTFNFKTRTNIPKKLEWSNDIRYVYNPNVVDFNKSYWFWNTTLSYSIFKDRASLNLKAYDLLNQNVSVSRVATSDFIQDSENTVLQRYFMLGFNWKFNSLGKKGKVREITFD